MVGDSAGGFNRTTSLGPLICKPPTVTNEPPTRANYVAHQRQSEPFQHTYVDPAGQFPVTTSRQANSLSSTTPESIRSKPKLYLANYRPSVRAMNLFGVWISNSFFVRQSLE